MRMLVGLDLILYMNWRGQARLLWLWPIDSAQVNVPVTRISVGPQIKTSAGKLQRYIHLSFRSLPLPRVAQRAAWEIKTLPKGIDELMNGTDKMVGSSY